MCTHLIGGGGGRGTWSSLGLHEVRKENRERIVFAGCDAAQLGSCQLPCLSVWRRLRGREGRKEEGRREAGREGGKEGGGRGRKEGRSHR